jgi:sortase B
LPDNGPRHLQPRHLKEEGSEGSEELELTPVLPPAQSERAAKRAAARAIANKKDRTKLSRLSLILGIVFLAIAICIIAFLFYKYINGNATYKKAEVAAGFDTALLGDTVAPDATADDFNINWDALREINPDIVGWVMIPGTRINYPIVQTTDNSYYLTHLFDRTPSDVGAIFLDYENDPNITGWNNMMYGHNLIDGSMFASLKEYQQKDYFDSHKKILLATPAKNYTLDVVAILVCDDEDEVRRFGFTDKADFDAYVQMLLEYAVLSELDEGEIPENLYCFATCTDTNYAKRTVVCATLSEPAEPTKSAESTSLEGNE